MWVLAPSELERLGWRFMTSLRDAGSWIVGPDGTGHPLRRAGRLLYLDGSIMERGVFHVGTTNGLCLRLLIDTGAEMNVAGVGYIEALEPDYPSCTAHPFKIAILSKGPVARGQMAATSERKSPKQ